MYFIYVYLDTRKEGSYSYGDIHFEYEPFYVGKGKGERHLSHLRIAKGYRSGNNNKVINKIKSILKDGFEPLILKIKENLTKESYNSHEIETIKAIGKQPEGPLLNITDGGDGGVTWIGDHHNKGKKLEEIVGLEKANAIKDKLSLEASLRVGELNPNWGNKGEMNPLFGKKMKQECVDKIRRKTLMQFSNYSESDIREMVNRMNLARKNIPDEIKKEWYEERSKKMKIKYKNQELFTDEHRQKLANNNFKKLNKGNDILKLSDDSKKKISSSLKNRKFTEEHRSKLRKCITFEEFETIIHHLIDSGLVTTITSYRKYAKNNPDLKYPITPEKSYKNYGWEGWRKYGL